jgi:hypothetical protein
MRPAVRHGDGVAFEWRRGSRGDRRPSRGGDASTRPSPGVRWRVEVRGPVPGCSSSLRVDPPDVAPGVDPGRILLVSWRRAGYETTSDCCRPSGPAGDCVGRRPDRQGAGVNPARPCTSPDHAGVRGRHAGDLGPIECRSGCRSTARSRVRGGPTRRPEAPEPGRAVETGQPVRWRVAARSIRGAGRPDGRPYGGSDGLGAGLGPDLGGRAARIGRGPSSSRPGRRSAAGGTFAAGEPAGRTGP